MYETCNICCTNGKIYLLSIRKVYVYDLISAQWSVFYEAHYHLLPCSAMAILYNKIYCIGGGSDECIYTFDLCDDLNDDPNTRKMVKMSLPSNGSFAGRVSLGAASLGGRLILMGGYFGENNNEYDDGYDPKDDDATDKIDIFDPSSSLFQEDSCQKMKERRAGPGVCALDGHLYIIGGHCQHPLYNSNEDESYDIMVTKSSVESLQFEGKELIQSSTTIEPMSVPRMDPAVAGYKGKLYVFGGLSDVNTDPRTYADSIEVYDTVDKTWTILEEKLVGARNLSNACLLNRSLALKTINKSRFDSI